MNNFYVYIYLDPRKPGNFNYGKYHFDFEPFYVGKGKNGRLYEHLDLNENNHFKNNKLKKIFKLFTQEELKSNYIIFQKSNMIESNAFKLEIDMIKTIGRKDLGLGPLTNLTDGGEGFTGKHSRETIEKIKNSEKDKIVSEKTKEKLRKAVKNRKPMSEETRNRMINSQQKRRHNEHTKKFQRD